MMRWEAFDAEVKREGKPIGSQSLLSHVRTDHVSAMLLAAGRIEAAPAAAAAAAADEGVGGARFIFLIAVPITLAADYLRIVGALARSLRNPAIIKALQGTERPEDFVCILCDEAAEL
jgi:mannitol/fructose-specific phosphotransferase system IIA component (Ntr-type)